MLGYSGFERSHYVSLVAFSTFDDIDDSFIFTGEWSFVFGDDYVDLA